MQSTTVGQPKRKTALPQEYSAQIHDWDLTLAAAAELTKAGLAADSRPTTGTLSRRSEEHTSELQSLMRISYAVFCLKKKINIRNEYRKQCLTTILHINN